MGTLRSYNSGKLSVMKKEDKQTVTRADLNIAPSIKKKTNSC